jgi:hypothetical protein
MALDREILPADDSTLSTTVVFDSNGGVAIDYSSYYERIASALENISTAIGVDSTSISGILASSAQSLENISTAIGVDSTSISGILASSAQSLENIQTSISEIKTLASTTGIKTQGVYDWVLLSSVYKLYVDDDGAIGLENLTEYKDKIESLPKS